MVELVVRTISRYNMLTRGDRVGVAVSGGPDSMALLHVLAELAAKRHLALHVLHLNHLLRGGESDGDAAFVAAAAVGLGLPCHIERADVRGAGGNLEQAAREARRAFFAAVRRRYQLTKIATGHTRDDQAETVLFRALRGSAPQGLRGILPVTAEGLIRPLLEVSRADVLRYLRARNVPWREDRTNADLSLRRNWIRGALLPEAARQVNPRAAEALARLADAAREEDEWIEQLVDEAAGAMLRPGSGCVLTPVQSLRSAPRGLARRLVRRALVEVTGRWRRFEMEHIEAVLALATRAGGGGRLRLPGVAVTRSMDWVRFCISEPAPEAWSYPVEGPGRWMTPAGEIAVESIMAALRPARLRSWCSGDLLRLPGHKRPIPLKRLFSKARVPVWDRNCWPVLEGRGELLWARRFGLADGLSQADLYIFDPPLAAEG